MTYCSYLSAFQPSLKLILLHIFILVGLVVLFVCFPPDFALVFTGTMYWGKSVTTSSHVEKQKPRVETLKQEALPFLTNELGGELCWSDRLLGEDVCDTVSKQPFANTLQQWEPNKSCQAEEFC